MGPARAVARDCQRTLERPVVSINEKLMRTVCRVGSYAIYGTTDEANWIYEKIQRPSSYYIVARNLLNWKLGRPEVYGIVALMMEPSFGCNLRCAYCGLYHWDSGNRRVQDMRPRFMSWETFTETVRKAPRTVETIQLCGLGEPLLNPQICEMCAFIDKAGFRPSLFTNATLLKGDLLKRLAQTPLDVLNVSVEPTMETCRDYRGIDLESIRESVREFVALKRPSTKVKLRIVAHSDSVNALSSVAGYWGGLIDDIKIGPVFKIEGDHQGFTCMEPWRGNLFVWSDGGVSPCAIDAFEDLTIGNIRNQTFEEIIHGEALREMMGRYSGGSVPERCARCTEVRPKGIPSLLPRAKRRAERR